jgi:hypothetical protein
VSTNPNPRTPPEPEMTPAPRPVWTLNPDAGPGPWTAFGHSDFAQALNQWWDALLGNRTIGGYEGIIHALVQAHERLSDEDQAQIERWVADAIGYGQ